MNEAEEIELEALMRQRRTSDSRLNRALGELLGSGDLVETNARARGTPAPAPIRSPKEIP